MKETIEKDTDWFSKLEEQIPPQDELTPISQSLITTDLALAFNIEPRHDPSPPQNQVPPSHLPDDSSDPGGSGTTGPAPSDEPARNVKQPRCIWTPELHKRFVDAIAQLGDENAVPSAIMQWMNVDGLTRTNVASHLQKYRLYLKSMEELSNPGGVTSADPATDHPIASGPVPPQPFVSAGAMHQHPQMGGPGPPHFLPFLSAESMHQHPQMGGPVPPQSFVSAQMGGLVPPHFLPFVSGGSMHQHPQMGGPAAHLQMNMHNYGQVGGGHLSSETAGNEQYENQHNFICREAQPSSHHRTSGGVGGIQPSVEDLDSADGHSDGNRRILNLFPTEDD